MAKSGINKVILVGNLGQDPETKYFTDGSAVTNFTMATGESWVDKSSGEKKEKTEWHRICVYGKLAEICGEYLKKGSKAYVEGSLQTRKWQDASGADRYTTEIKAYEMQMLDSRGADNDTPKPAGLREGQSRTAQKPQGHQSDLGSSTHGPNHGDDVFDDDIPF